METKIIKAIFTNVLFVIGVILLIVGFVSGTSVLVRSIVFDKYPLNDYEETRCDFQYSSIRETSVIAVEPEEIVEEDKSRNEQLHADCLENLENYRKTNLVDDLTRSITLLISGGVLTLVFKQFIFTKET